MLWYSYERVCLCEYKHLVIKNAYKYFSTHHFTMFHVFALSLLSASCALFVSSFAIIQSSCMLCIIFFQFSIPLRTDIDECCFLRSFSLPSACTTLNPPPPIRLHCQSLHIAYRNHLFGVSIRFGIRL